MRRRAVLGAIATGTVAGCLGDEHPDREDHSAAQRLSDLPQLGAAPDDAERLIVAFEDPSCSTCRRFHESSFPDLQRTVLNSTDISYVYRPYPVVLPWGAPASRAILATAEHDVSTAWELISWYYATQSSISDDDVLESTGRFLDAETDVAGESVVDDVRSGLYDTATDAALADGEAAGATTTPTFFLFRKNEFVTHLTGVQDVSVFTSSLGV